MHIKNFLTYDYWNFEKVVLILGLLIALATLIYTVHPTFLFPEKVGFNPEIRLEKTLLSQQHLICFEKVNKSKEIDKLESFEILNTGNSNEKQVTLKLAEADNSDKFIFIALTDPNNIIRFVSMPIDNDNLINESLSSALRRISVQKQIKIKIPTSNEFNIQGTWHLNIYLYNSEKELSLVITRPLDLSTISNEDDLVSNILSFFMLFSVITFFILSRILTSKKNDKEHGSLVNIEAIHTNQPNQSRKDRELNEIQGIIVDVPRYGLIKRCSDCSQIIEKGICREHGKVKGIYDLYIEAILFDGFSEHIIMIEKPIMENLLKINLDQCIKIAEEYLDMSIIREMIKKQMFGRFYLIEGIYLAEGMKAKSIEINSQIPRMELLGLYDRWKMSKGKIIGD